MLTPIFDFLKNVMLRNRPEIIKERGGEEFIFNGNKNAYERVLPLLLDPARSRTVSNAEALAQVVIEEAIRAGNKTGTQMTVIFEHQGGFFFPDDLNRKNPDSWVFNRKLSKQLIALEGVLNKEFSHADLIRAMSSIRFNVENFGDIFMAMRRIRIGKKVNIVSQPRIVDGKQGGEISFGFEIEGENGAAQKAQFPGEFKMCLPLISMSKVIYNLEIEIDSWTDDKQIYFALLCPGLEAQKTESILDEIEDFTKVMKAQLPELLIVTNL